MGNFCSMQSAVGKESKVQKSARLDLIGQLSYDICKIEVDPDWKDDFEEDRFSRRNSKQYYEVTRSPVSRMGSQLLSSTWSSFGSGTSAGTPNWTRSQQHSSMEFALEDLVLAQRHLHTETSTPSSPVASSSSGTSTFELSQSHYHFAELESEEPSRVERVD